MPSPAARLRPRRARLLIVALIVATLLSGCSAPTLGDGGPAGRLPSPTGPPPRSSPPGPDGTCVDNGWFDCDFRDRFAAVERYVAARPGVVGVVVHDRRTGAEWSSAHAEDYLWTASSIKLAMAINLLQRNRAGELELSESDWELMTLMITESDNLATDTLWSTYGGLPSESYVDSGLPYVESTEDLPGAWGSELATPTAMADLLDYGLAALDPDDADWLVEAMCAVIDEQRWGVLSLGEDARPGAKNGWDEEPTGWVVNTIGFVGPRERYTVAIMNDLGADGDFDAGVETVSSVAQLLFDGRF